MARRMEKRHVSHVCAHVEVHKKSKQTEPIIHGVFESRIVVSLDPIVLSVLQRQ